MFARMRCGVPPRVSIRKSTPGASPGLREPMLGAEARIDLEQLDETPRHEPGAAYEHHCQCDLADDERVAQPAGFRDLHFGDELRAPNGLFKRVRQAIAIPVMMGETFGGGIQRLEQSERYAAVAVLVHELVVIASAMPPARGINMFAVR